MSLYEDVHETCMEEDGSEKPPDLGLVSHTIRVVAAEVIEDYQRGTEKVIRVHGVFLS